MHLALRQGDYVDFYQDIFGEAGYFYRRSRWRGSAEVFAVDFVHGGELAHVLEEYRAADDFAEAASRSFKNL
jgi:hypothetical protein